MTDKELLRIVKQFRKGILNGDDPDGKCGVVCLPLQGFLSVSKLNTKIVQGTVEYKKGKLSGVCNHVWLELPDGRILDPTADQFNDVNAKKMPAVYLGKKPDWFIVSKQKLSKKKLLS